MPSNAPPGGTGTEGGSDSQRDRETAGWDAAAAALTPVIGTLGFDALFERSVRLVSRRHAWLAAVGAVPAGERLRQLELALAARDAASAAAVQAALHKTFAQMLGHLIGAPLAQRLLRTRRRTLPARPGRAARGH